MFSLYFGLFRKRFKGLSQTNPIESALVNSRLRFKLGPKTSS